MRSEGHAPPGAEPSPSARAARRVVVKVGTTTLTGGGAALDPGRLDSLVRQIVALRGADREVILVSSGAIVTGATRLGLTRRARSMPERQALAAVGQAILMHEYERRFTAAGVVVAQILLTADDLSDRRRYRLAQDAFQVLLRQRVVPIVNENDTVATDEIKIGDNDTLSALVACMLDVDLLCILSDVPGLYTADPHREAGARL
ncbi:MAG: glutamate 5-kinase, partial [Anaerolineales bacterium]